jgi:hypothetical protein
MDTVKGLGETIRDGDVKNALDRNVGLFLNCKVNSVNMVMVAFFPDYRELVF